MRQHLQDKKDKSLLIHKNVIYTKKSNSIYIDDNIYIHGDIVNLDAWVYMIHKLILVLVCFWKTEIYVAQSFSNVEILRYDCNLDNIKLQYYNFSGFCKYNCRSKNCFLIMKFCNSVYFIILNITRPLQEIMVN